MNPLKLDPDPEFWSNLDSSSNPRVFLSILKNNDKIVFEQTNFVEEKSFLKLN